MNQLFDSIQGAIGQSLPGVFGALLILFIGWIVANVVKGIVKKALNLCQLNKRINLQGEDAKLDLEAGIAKGGYFVVLLIALVAVFNQLGLEIAAQPIQALVTQIMEYIPKLIGGAALVLVAWLCSTIVKQVLTAALHASGLDSKIESQGKALSSTIGEIGYWLIFLIFLPGILAVFGVEGLLQPAQSMLDKIMGMLPNVMAATLIVFAGWLIAKILRDITTSLLSTIGADNLGEKIGISGETKLSKVVGIIIYFFTFVPAIIAALNTLEIEAIAQPATNMLTSIMAMIPNILGAIAIVLITYMVAKPISGLISNMLKAAGADRIPQNIGIKNDNIQLSQLLGKVVFFFMMLFASVEAVGQLKFEKLSELIAMFIQFGGQVLLGTIIMAIGLWIANLASTAINKTSPDGFTPMSTIIRVVILGLVLTMGLRAMGIANDIVNMAFGLTLGSAAIAFALSFGLGGREAAGRQLEYWFSNMRQPKKGSKDKLQPTA